ADLHAVFEQKKLPARLGAVDNQFLLSGQHLLDGFQVQAGLWRPPRGAESTPPVIVEGPRAPRPHLPSRRVTLAPRPPRLPPPPRPSPPPAPAPPVRSGILPPR